MIENISMPGAMQGCNSSSTFFRAKFFASLPQNVVKFGFSKLKMGMKLNEFFFEKEA